MQRIKNIIAPNNLILIGTIILQLIVIILLGNILKKTSYLLIDRLFEDDNCGNDRQADQTLNSLLKSLFRYGIYFIGITMGLKIMGIPTFSILAGAGVVGLAVSFGARNLVEDIITGFFILFEGQFGVGDYIKTAGIDGVVKEMDLRVTRIQNFDGDIHIIPNSEIKQVTNYTTADSRVIINIGVSYEENIAEVINILDRYIKELKITGLKSAPQVVGIEEFGDSSIIIRISAWTDPLEKWQVARKLRQKIKEKLDQEKIEIPYPKRVIIKQNN
nr:mechanosensitive ion channel family protein [Sporohalobacter salinus]